MNFKLFSSWFFVVLALLGLGIVSAKKDKEMYCAACKVVVEEVEYAISKINPDKTIQIEGFRVDPKGNQNTKSIPYARSETHLTEVSENLCSQMNKYAQSKDKETGALKFVRTDSRDGEPVTLENVSLSGDFSNKLRYVCDNIIEEHEEDIVKYFKKERENSVAGFCTKLTKLCTDKIVKKEL